MQTNWLHFPGYYTRYMLIHPAKLQQVTPTWRFSSSLRAWSKYQVNDRTWRQRLCPSLQHSWRAVAAWQQKAKQKQVLPTNVRLHWQPSLELGLEIAGQFTPGKQPKFAATTQRSMLLPSHVWYCKLRGGTHIAATGSTHKVQTMPINSNLIWHSLRAIN